MSRTFEVLSQIDSQRRARPRSHFAAAPEAIQQLRFGLTERVRYEIANLVESLFLAPSQVPPRVVVFSAIGCSAAAKVCAYAGDFLAAQSANSVCLIDANLQGPELHQLLGIPNQKGVADLQLGVASVNEVAVQLGNRLSAIPAGTRCAERDPVLDIERARASFIELQASFDYALICTTPAARDAAAVTLSRLADGVVLVIQANSTRREVALKVKQDLEGAGVRLLGAVLNDHTVLDSRSHLFSPATYALKSAYRPCCRPAGSDDPDPNLPEQIC